MKFKNMFIVMMMAFVFTSCESGFEDVMEEANTDVKVYNVGDIGPAGGTIFYINSNYMEDGWRYLEASPKSLEFKIKWSHWTDKITGTYPEIGKGYDNTIIVITRIYDINEPLKSNPLYGDHPECAARDCKNISYVFNSITFNDWFLPSRSELITMGTVLVDLTSGPYWSSSQHATAVLAYTYPPDDGSNKGGALWVRPVRRF